MTDTKHATNDSAANGKPKKTERQERDHYITPAWATEALLNAAPELLWPQRILDPAAGNGGILDVVTSRISHRLSCVGIELDAERAAAKGYIHGNGLEVDWRGYTVIMNPPYSEAQAFIERGLIQGVRFAALLRLGFLASGRRYDGLWETVQGPPDHVLVLSERPSFAHGRTENSEYAWFVWGLRVHRPMLGWLRRSGEFRW